MSANAMTTILPSRAGMLPYLKGTFDRASGTYEPFDPIPMLAALQSFDRMMRAESYKHGTVKTYGQNLNHFLCYLRDVEGVTPADPSELTRDMVEGWMGAQADAGLLKASISNRYRTLSRFVHFCIDREFIDSHPRSSPLYKVGDVLSNRDRKDGRKIETLSEATIAALLNACEGKTFEDRRDTAIIQLWLDTGGRVGEFVNLAYDPVNEDYSDIEFFNERVSLDGKTDQRWCPIGAKTAEGLDRYLALRAKHPAARDLVFKRRGPTQVPLPALPNVPALWLGKKGALGVSGMQSMLNRRAAQAGIGHIHPHQFRHTFASDWLRRGGNEGNLMVIMGWRNRDMIEVYGRHTAELRAIEEHKRLRPGDSHRRRSQ